MDDALDDTTPAAMPTTSWTAPADAWGLPATVTAGAPSPHPPARERTAGRGLLSGAGAALLAVAKYGGVLLKAGKLGPTFVSMAISLVLLTQLYGFAFGLGLLVLIAVHESGHMLFARYERVPVSAPIFLGIFGAVIGMKQPPRDARQE